MKRKQKKFIVLNVVQESGDIMEKRINMELVQAINKVCHTTEKCGQCAGKNCLVGFSRYANNYSKNNQTSIIPNGFDELPQSDMRGGYTDDDVLETIAKTLVFCKSCKKDHDANCVLALVRDCMEVITIGDEQDYDGDPITYLQMFAEHNKDLGIALKELYVIEKEKQQNE